MKKVKIEMNSTNILGNDHLLLSQTRLIIISHQSDCSEVNFFKNIPRHKTLG